MTKAALLSSLDKCGGAEPLGTISWDELWTNGTTMKSNTELLTSLDSFGMALVAGNIPCLGVTPLRGLNAFSVLSPDLAATAWPAQTSCQAQEPSAMKPVHCAHSTVLEVLREGRFDGFPGMGDGRRVGLVQRQRRVGSADGFTRRHCKPSLQEVTGSMDPCVEPQLPPNPCQCTYIPFTPAAYGCLRIQPGCARSCKYSCREA